MVLVVDQQILIRIIPGQAQFSSIIFSGGASKSDQLYVQNGSDKEETIEVYSVDGTVTTTGDMTCKEKSENKVGAGGGFCL